MRSKLSSTARAPHSGSGYSLQEISLEKLLLVRASSPCTSQANILTGGRDDALSIPFPQSRDQSPPSLLERAYKLLSSVHLQMKELGEQERSLVDAWLKLIEDRASRMRSTPSPSDAAREGNPSST
jgi:hypothetical protein